MVSAQPTPQQVQAMMDEAMQQSIAMTAKLFGLPEETVSRIVQVGLPVMARLAVEDPDTLKRLYAMSMGMMGQSLPSFYGNLGQEPQAQQTLRDDFARTYGPQAPVLTRDVAGRAGTNEEQTGNGLAGAMPGMAYGSGKQNPQPSEDGFTANLRNLIEQYSGETPSRVGATQQEGQVLVWAAFDTLDGAATALAGLQDSPLARRVTAENAAVIEKDAEGKVSLSETADRSGGQGLKRGVGLGGLLGAFMPALAILPAAAVAGGAGGFLSRLRDTGFDDDQLRQAAEQLEPNSSALVALVDPETAIDLERKVGSRAKRVRNVFLAKKGINLLQGLGS